jgi:hypothetical protein
VRTEAGVVPGRSTDGAGPGERSRSGAGPGEVHTKVDSGSGPEAGPVPGRSNTAPGGRFEKSGTPIPGSLGLPRRPLRLSVSGAGRDPATKGGCSVNYSGPSPDGRRRAGSASGPAQYAERRAKQKITPAKHCPPLSRAPCIFISYTSPRTIRAAASATLTMPIITSTVPYHISSIIHRMIGSSS